MGRSSRAEAALHREKVVEATSRMLRERGVSDVSVQEAMSAAGLTHGGFYKHFASKDELMATAAESAFADVESRLERVAQAAPDAPTARERIVEDYLTVEHRDSAAGGCANAALAADSARASDSALRAAYTAGLKRTVARLESLEAGPGARERALEDLIVLVGGLVLARATTGDPISEDLLAAARERLRR